eukprot:c12388_g2_i3.p1 GENE.c12388_g2_i3~~c12388_g2_i3.p1  ORF type:complete len:189 (+),score=73.67 c12388_g2_i3:231-797(+)
MGVLLSKVFARTQQARILLLGLDGAGKTTILYKLALGETINTTPTVGFNVETVKHKNVDLTMWDVGGQQKLRALWRYYMQGCNGLVFVVDSNDRDADRIDEAAHALRSLTQSKELCNCAVVVLANKQDMPHAMTTQELQQKLGLDTMRQKWTIQACCAVQADGLFEGFDWLVANLPPPQKSHRPAWML